MLASINVDAGGRRYSESNDRRPEVLLMERFDAPFDAGGGWSEDWAAAFGRTAEEERTLAVEQACELLGLRAGRMRIDNGLAGPITKEDRDLIVWNIDELFLV